MLNGLTHKANVLFPKFDKRVKGQLIDLPLFPRSVISMLVLATAIL